MQNDKQPDTRPLADRIVDRIVLSPHSCVAPVLAMPCREGKRLTFRCDPADAGFARESVRAFIASVVSEAEDMARIKAIRDIEAAIAARLAQTAEDCRSALADAEADAEEAHAAADRADAKVERLKEEAAAAEKNAAAVRTLIRSILP